MYGSYCEVHEDHEIARWGTPAICLGPTGNIQGTHNFFSLMTGLVIKQRNFTELPIPQSVINRVTHFAQNSGVPSDLVFLNRHHVPFDWPDNDSGNSLDPTPIGVYPDIPAEMPGVMIDHSTPGVPSITTPMDGPNHDPD